jgi:transposase
MIVPLDLPEFRVVEQSSHPDGCLRVKVIATRSRAVCPHCSQPSERVHDCRERRKRDLSIRGYQVQLIVLKRRYRCACCRKTFTEPDEACGPRRRTTCRLREAIGRQATRQPVASVSQSFDVGPRFVRECFQTVTRLHLISQGICPDEQARLPAPRFLGIDEFAVRKGQRYATILCDLHHRRVLEVSLGRSFLRWSDSSDGLITLRSLKR